MCKSPNVTMMGRYVSGDYRFRNGYCRSNPRKMVKMWAEKEMRNLMRLCAAGILAPAPLQLRMHVLVMQFIGEDGIAAPRLRDAGLPLQRLRTAYTEILLVLRNLYQKCRLVHADLSEYNILYHKVRGILETKLNCHCRMKTVSTGCTRSILFQQLSLIVYIDAN